MNISLYPYYSDGCYTSQYGSAYLGDSTYFYIQTYQDCYGNQSSYAQFNKYSYSDVYFSSNYYKLYQTSYSYSGSYAYGTPLNAINSVTSRFIVEGDAGGFGGNGNFGYLYYYPFDYSWDYFEFDWSDGLYDERVTGSYRGKSVYGSTYGVTTP